MLFLFSLSSVRRELIHIAYLRINSHYKRIDVYSQ